MSISVALAVVGMLSTWLPVAWSGDPAFSYTGSEDSFLASSVKMELTDPTLNPITTVREHSDGHRSPRLLLVWGVTASITTLVFLMLTCLRFIGQSGMKANQVNRSLAEGGGSGCVEIVYGTGASETSLLGDTSMIEGGRKQLGLMTLSDHDLVLLEKAEAELISKAREQLESVLTKCENLAEKVEQLTIHVNVAESKLAKRTKESKGRADTFPEIARLREAKYRQGAAIRDLELAKLSLQGMKYQAHQDFLVLTKLANASKERKLKPSIAQALVSAEQVLYQGTGYHGRLSAVQLGNVLRISSELMTEVGNVLADMQSASVHSREQQLLRVQSLQREAETLSKLLRGIGQDSSATELEQATKGFENLSITPSRPLRTRLFGSMLRRFFFMSSSRDAEQTAQPTIVHTTHETSSQLRQSAASSPFPIQGSITERPPPLPKKGSRKSAPEGTRSVDTVSQTSEIDGKVSSEPSGSGEQSTIPSVSASEAFSKEVSLEMERSAAQSSMESAALARSSLESTAFSVLDNLMSLDTRLQTALIGAHRAGAIKELEVVFFQASRTLSLAQSVRLHRALSTSTKQRLGSKKNRIREKLETAFHLLLPRWQGKCTQQKHSLLRATKLLQAAQVASTASASPSGGSLRKAMLWCQEELSKARELRDLLQSASLVSPGNAALSALLTSLEICMDSASFEVSNVEERRVRTSPQASPQASLQASPRASSQASSRAGAEASSEGS